MTEQPIRLFFTALIVALGLAAGGWFIGQGFVQGRLNDRFVTVKGVAETTVRADLAIWPMRFVATGNDLTAVHARLAADADKVAEFLVRNGLARDSIELQSLEVTDLMAQDRKQELLTALAGLEPEDRRLIHLAYWEQCPLVEVARRLELSCPSEARRRLVRALDRLRRRLESVSVNG